MMHPNLLFVLVIALIYWGNVARKTISIRLKSGAMPEVTPKGLKENVIWVFWSVVVGGQFAMPFIMMEGGLLSVIIVPMNFHAFLLWAGIAFILIGLAGTFYCYHVMGVAWSMSANRENNSLIKTGPFKTARHPIYGLQMLILLGMFCIVPSVGYLVLLILLVICAHFKASDEERILIEQFGDDYREYMKTTRKFRP